MRNCDRRRAGQQRVRMRDDYRVIVDVRDPGARVSGLGGLRVRIALADPDGAEVKARDALEELGGTLPGRIRSTMGHLEPLFSSVGVEIRYHGASLYNALYRFDDQMLITPYLYKLHGYQHPLLHLKRLGPAGLFESYAQQFEAIWTESRPALDNVTSL